MLPIGGVKEKTLAADRAGIRTVILPDKNQRDMEEVDKEVSKKVSFEFVETVDDLVRHAFDPSALAHAIDKNRKEERKQALLRKQEKHIATPAAGLPPS